ncbi:MAG: PQQ-dependent sugar dehydrogenase [Acidobacteria bacterium]|nr:PQQ-dependent sugar dehydrogenase [Acidobacteriota bacterium]
MRGQVKKVLFLVVVWVVVAVKARALPGFRVEKVGDLVPFVSSIAVDSKGQVYYATTSGKIIRGAQTVATVDTDAMGNSGLIGMALESDDSAVVHYTTLNQTADVIARIDLGTGQETVIHEFVCDIEVPSRGSNPEHHGGNPIVAPDGSIFVAIGDYGSFAIAAKPEWNAGKVFRIRPDGSVEQFARGFRNPFDMAWDAANERLFIPDNGDANDDEINIIQAGAFCGWPFTMGNGPDVDGAVKPVYVWPSIVAPTGVVAPANRLMKGGYLIATFVGKTIFFVKDDSTPVSLIDAPVGSIVDVAETPDGRILFTTGLALYELVMPKPGDCNGDGLVNAQDLDALDREPAGKTTDARNWGCDANADGFINADDRISLLHVIAGRVRAVR